MTKQFNVTELDFDKIKDNIKNYLKSQDKFSDYNFEGSALSVLIDMLAYNTHYNAVNAHYSLNEAFIDSAQLRSSVVSHAKLLSYTPRSVLCSSIRINITVNNPVGSPPPAFITMPRGTKFVTNLGTEQYVFVTTETQNASYDEANNNYYFSDVEIKEGVLKRIRFRVDNDIEIQKFEIPEKNVDISTLKVLVRDNEESSKFTSYTKFTELFLLNDIKNVYFLNENTNEKYEIFFGDGVIGVKPNNDNIVELEYIYSKGTIANGAGSFRLLDNIAGNTDVTLDLQGNKSSGGAERESIESVRFNAPLTFITQNRAITADDYIYIIRKEVPNIEAISVWGGEVASPPDFGKVFISIKPVGANALTQSEKDNVIQNVLKTKNVVSITPVLVDPEFSFIEVEATFKYNPNLTNLIKIQLESVVRSAIISYNDNNLKQFDGVFRASQLLNAIDNSNEAILNSTISIRLFKKLTSQDSQKKNYFVLNFSAPLGTSSDPNASILESTGITVNGQKLFFGDRAIEQTNSRRIYLFREVNGRESIVQNDVGEIDVITGEIVLYNFITDAAEEFRIFVKPLSNDIAPKRNQLVNIDPNTIKAIGEVDTIALAGSTGAITYNTTPRD